MTLISSSLQNKKAKSASPPPDPPYQPVQNAKSFWPFDAQGNKLLRRWGGPARHAPTHTHRTHTTPNNNFHGVCPRLSKGNQIKHTSNPLILPRFISL